MTDEQLLEQLNEAARAAQEADKKGQAGNVVPLKKQSQGSYTEAVKALKGMAEHDAVLDRDEPRWSPVGFPFPVWSDADLERGDQRRFTGGSSKQAGKVLLKDRRKPWQKECATSFDRTGCICTSLSR